MLQLDMKNKNEFIKCLKKNFTFRCFYTFFKSAFSLLLVLSLSHITATEQVHFKRYV
jgi:hypothetical protein